MKTNSMRTFYTLVLTQTLSLIGSRISGLALGIWLYNETGNATPLALVAFFFIVPQVIMSSFAGVLADRWDRRYVIALSDLGQAAGTLLLLVLFVSGSFQVWHLYLVTFIQSVFGVFQGPAFIASITMLVPDEKRNRANAIRQMTEPASGIVAPALAGLVFAALGVTGAIVIDLLTFLAAFGVILLVRIPRPRKSEEGAELSGSVWQEMLGGLRYLWRRQTLFWVVIVITAHNFLFGVAGVLLTPYLLARTGDEATYGLILSLFNAGGLIGGLLVSIWGNTKSRMRIILTSLLIVSVLMLLFGMAQSTLMLIAIAPLVLIPSAILNALFISMLQVKTAPDVQGRVFAVLSQLAMLLMPISYLLAGPLADQVAEPLVGQPVWSAFAPLFGTQAGAGMGLILGVVGVLATLLSLGLIAAPAVRQLEQRLPDYVPQADAEAEADIAVAPGTNPV